jgi:hypothetical protein
MSEAQKTSMHPPRAPEAQPELPDLQRAAELASELARQRSMPGLAQLHAPLLQRFDTSGAPGMQALQFGGRFARAEMRGQQPDMPVSPYAPPQRQISTVRQGAPMWPPPQTQDAPQTGVAQPKRRAAPSDGESLPSDLQALLELHRRRGHIS